MNGTKGQSSVLEPFFVVKKQRHLRQTSDLRWCFWVVEKYQSEKGKEISLESA